MKIIYTLSGFVFLFYFCCIHYTESQEIGLMYDVRDSQVILDSPGFNITAPWIFVSKIDTRPQRVCITSVAKVLNCKLVQFLPNQYKAFIQREGWRYYWWDNRISFNSGYKEEYRGFRDILRGYAFDENSPHKFPFIQML